MLSSHIRGRFVALMAAVPMLVAVGPTVSAYAVGGFIVNSSVADGQVLGPHAGYLGIGTGQDGTVEVFRITPPDLNASISSVTVTLTGDSTKISLGRDFDGGDGFALYYDFDGVAGLSAEDKQKGLVSAGWSQGATEPDGDTAVVIALPAAVSQHAFYYVTVHPASVNWPIRPLTLRMDPDAVQGSDTGPTNVVSTPTGDNRLTIDSVGPNTGPAKGFFTPHSQITPTEDTYTVARGANPETGAKVAFYSLSDPAEANVLVRPDTSRAVETILPDSPTASGKDISIGDGTGVTPAHPVGTNGQRSNSVYVRTIDPVGNFSPATALLEVSTDTDTTRRGNIVVGPAKPTSALFNSQINAASYTAVPVKVVTNTAAPATPNDTASVATKSKARIVQLGTNGSPDYTKASAFAETAWVGGTTGAILTFDTRSGPENPGIDEGASAVAETATVDALGNVSDIVTSAAQQKDTKAPVLSVVDAARSGLAQAGDNVRLSFSEPMITTTVTGRAVTGTRGDGSNKCDPPPTETAIPASYIDNRLPIKTIGAAARTWGYNACVVWAADGASATVTVGEAGSATTLATCGSTPPQTPCPVLFSTGDLVTPVAAVTDLVGNPLHGATGTATQTGTTTIGASTAFPETGQTLDENADGTLDAIDIQFTADVDINGFSAFSLNLSVVGTSSTVPVDGVVYPTPADHSNVRFYFGGTFGTGERPSVRLSRPDGGSTGMFTDEGTPREVLPFSKTPDDKAAPRPIGAVYTDGGTGGTPVAADGHIDRVTITYSEPIDHTKDNNAAALATVPGYAVPGYLNFPASPQTPNRNTVLNPTGTTNTTQLSLMASSSFDTGSPTVTVSFTKQDALSPSCTDVPCTARDTATPNNAGGNYQIPVTDAAAPFIVSRTTRDIDNDGKIDAIDVKFSEAIASTSIGGSLFTVAGHERGDPFGLTGAGDIVRVPIDEVGDPGTGDTGAKPAVSYQSGIMDTQGNAAPADPATPPATLDGAGPAIVAACPKSPAPNNGSCPAGDDGTQILVKFSEPLSSTTVSKTKFVVEQPAGTTKDQSADPTVATDKLSATLNFAAGATAIDETQDSWVRFATDAAVTDAASPANPSHQTSSIVAPAIPQVTLAITCSIPASAGYCGSTTVNLVITATSGITQWRIAETPRASDSTYTTSAPPTQMTLPEGAHTLYLSGRDALGRTSAEVSASVTILLAPTISNVQLANATPGRSSGWSKTDPTDQTVLDGDSVQIGADAQGSDAAEWAANSAPTGGGCLAQHMSIDLRAITGKSNQSAIPPLRCDLKTNTAPPHRQMQFPFVKVTKTTHYPVGTVLKSTTSGIEYLIVDDGLTGAQLRRRYISVNARRSWQISDSLVIKVPTELLSGIPSGSGIGYRDGAIVRASGTGYYYVSNSIKRPISTKTLAYFRIPTSVAYVLSAAEMKAMATGVGIAAGGAHPVGTWIKFANGKIQQVTRNAAKHLVRRNVATSSALKTLVPLSQIYPANSKDADPIKVPLDSWVRGYRDGTLLKMLTGNRYAVVSRSSLRIFSDGKTFNSLGYSTSNAITANGGAMPHVAGSAYRTGATIDRYKISTVVIKVTNKAGAVVTAIVTPVVGWIYGLGTLDPLLTKWDSTRV